jgi:pentapeptide MXKDX repeat protein
MKLSIIGAFCATAILSGGAVFAADQMSSDSSMSHSQMMKDCMAKQKAKDSSMSKDDVKKACMDQMKMSKDHAMAPSTAPSQTTPSTQGSPNPSSAAPPPK